MFSVDLALHLLSNKKTEKPQKEDLSLSELSKMITAYDLGRLKSFTNNMVEYRLIVDLVPSLAKIFFLFNVAGLDGLHLSPIQKGILIGIGLQFKTVDTLATELNVDGKQLLGKFRDMMRQMLNSIEKAKGEAIKSSILSSSSNDVNREEESSSLAPLGQELQEAAKEMQQKQKEAFLGADLSQYSVKGSEDVWRSALSQNKGKLNLISVKTGINADNNKRAKAEDENNQDSTAAAPKNKKFKKMKRKSAGKGK